MKSVREDPKGYVYFIKHDNNTGESISSLDYPEFQEKFQDIQEKHEKTKYFTYRIAGKIFDLTRNVLKTNRIPYQLVLGILDRHRMINSSVLVPKTTKEVCSEIFYAAYRLGYLAPEENLEVCKYSLLNLIWNIFDPKRNKTNIAVSDFKQLMLMLCESSCFQSKLYEYFDLVCDHNQLLPRAKFEAMCLCFARIFSYLDKSASQFGMNWIEDTVSETFEKLPGLCGLTQLQFFDLWSSGTSKFASFSNIVALIQRLHESQFVTHQKECVGCHVSPINGLRFKCQQCRKLSLCLTCFSTGFSSNKHSTSHKMYEISSDEGGKCFTFGKFFSKMCSMSHDQSMEKQEIKIQDTGDDGEVNQSVVKIASHSMKRGTINKSMVSGYGWADGQRTLSRSVAINATGKILKIADGISETRESLLNNLNMFKQNLTEEQLGMLKSHCDALDRHIKELRECGQVTSVPFSSTPFRATASRSQKKRPPLLNVSAPLFNSIRGAELNKTFLEENKSLSINDLSNWFQIDNTEEIYDEKVTTMTKTDTKMTNFRKLLYQVKEIVDDSYSDNALLAEKTKNLEQELDAIIGNEEERRSQKHG